MRKVLSALVFTSVLTVPVLSPTIDVSQFSGEFFTLAGTRCPKDSERVKGQLLDIRNNLYFLLSESHREEAT